MNRFLIASLLLGLSLLWACGPSVSDDPEILARLPEQVDFNYHIKPIFSDRCFSCHGPDAEKREADLRLDTEAGAFAALGKNQDRFAIKAGSLKGSQVYHRINSSDPEVKMPPPESNLSLSAYEMALINKWIDQGAEWKAHWSFIPPQKACPPQVQNTAWLRNAIDYFILKKLERNQVEPSPEADKSRLLRRVSMDLTGLPPSLAEMDAFLADTSPDAYERVVDRLLAAPAYGERMALEWMDVARYADSHGLHADGWRSMWPWRDWVIDAFNQNMPFDRFVTWQMAGDLLPEASPTQMLATAFHRNHPMTAEGGVVDEEWRLEYVFDRATTTARAFLGLTLECARCHDHKFDPISQKEFYQVSAFFNNVHELGMTGDDGNYGPCMLLPDAATQQELVKVNQQLRQTRQKLALTEASVTEIKAYLARKTSPQVPSPLLHLPMERPGKILDGQAQALISGKLETVPGKVGKALAFGRDYDMLHLKDMPVLELDQPYSVAAWIYLHDYEGFQTIMGNAGEKNNFWRGWDFFVDTLGHLSLKLIHNLPHDYIHVSSEQQLPLQSWVHVCFSYEGTGEARGTHLYINGELVDKQVAYDRLQRSIHTVSSSSHEPFVRPIRVGKSYRAFTGENGLFRGNIDEVRIYRTALSDWEVRQLIHPEANQAQWQQPWEKWPVRAQARLNRHYLQRQHAGYQVELARYRELKAEKMALLDSVPEVMIMEEMAQPRTMHVLDRGVYDAPLEPVTPGVLSELGGFPAHLPRNRLGMARWLLDPGHPLTARVSVNRFWQQYFGQGLVSTPEDFGNQGALPTHPELLDWLAVQFIESGWDIKALQKLIVMSATYRQASTYRPALAERDPENLLLARGPSYRLPAELIRDNVLAASGLLVRKIGGPSVKPYQPPGLWIDKGNFSHILLHYHQDSGESLYRRSLYTFIRRTSPPPSMIVFDASDRNSCVVRRQRTNTPLQALVLLNDPQYVEAARMLAERMQKEGGASLEKMLSYGFRLLSGRRPSSEEIALFVELYAAERAKFAEAPEKAEALMQVGEMPRDVQLSLIETAALSMVANVMINHDEVYMKR